MVFKRKPKKQKEQSQVDSSRFQTSKKEEVQKLMAKNIDPVEVLPAVPPSEAKTYVFAISKAEALKHLA